MKDAMIQVFDMVRNSFAGNWFLIFWVLSLIYLFFAEKEKRRILVYPSIFVGILIINPILYRYVWHKVFDNAYWRAFWMLPILPVIAVAIVSLVGKCRKGSLKILIIAGSVALCVFTGTFVYKDRLVFRQNFFKIPGTAIDVSNALLALDREPRAAVDSSLFCYIRQYSPDIHLLYGRDAWGYIDVIDEKPYGVYQQMTQHRPDLHYVHDRMKDLGYDYLVMLPAQIPQYRPEDAEEYDASFYRDALKKSGFQYLEMVDGYIICQVM
ncbi:MAG: hypothetical protein ACI4ET_00705 [Bilifractor sp.]